MLAAKGDRYICCCTVHRTCTWTHTRKALGCVIRRSRRVVDPVADKSYSRLLYCWLGECFVTALRQGGAQEEGDSSLRVAAGSSGRRGGAGCSVMLPQEAALDFDVLYDESRLPFCLC